MWLRSRYPLVASRDEHCEENSQRYSHRGVGMPPNPSAPASIFFKAVVIWCTRAVGARSSLELLPIERLRASVSVIRACPWAWEVNSNSYWSDQAGLLPRGQDRPGQLAS
jgi:hypothetical protein